LSVTETVLYFVVIPLGAVLTISGLAVAGSGRSAKRYRPGRSYDFTPVWFLSAPEELADSHAPALPAGARRAELTTGRETDKAGVASPAGTTGGASDRW
jgi:hypothetical protein